MIDKQSDSKGHKALSDKEARSSPKKEPLKPW